MVEAAKRSGKLLQVGTQSRSSPVVHEAVKLIRKGVLDEVYTGKAFVYRFRADIGRKEDGDRVLRMMVRKLPSPVQTDPPQGVDARVHAPVQESYVIHASPLFHF
jgi:hypothetical protein